MVYAGTIANPLALILAPATSEGIRASSRQQEIRTPRRAITELKRLAGRRRLRGWSNQLSAASPRSTPPNVNPRPVSNVSTVAVICITGYRTVASPYFW